MATAVEHGTRCSVCRRSLLVGEAARTYQDPRSRSIHSVCPLCTARADRVGWQLIGEGEARKPLSVRSDNEVDHERLVRRLQNELERLERDLGGKVSELEGERVGREQLERRIEQLLADLDVARAHSAALEGRLDEKDQALANAERLASESQAAQEMLLRARRREADPAYICGIAVEVFNRSAQREAVAATVAAHGTPTVRIGIDGVHLPRSARVVFAWPGGSRSYRVKCDLVARIFDVEDLAHGAGLQPVVAPFAPNVALADGKLELLHH